MAASEDRTIPSEDEIGRTEGEETVSTRRCGSETVRSTKKMKEDREGGVIRRSCS